MATFIPALAGHTFGVAVDCGAAAAGTPPHAAGNCGALLVTPRAVIRGVQHRTEDRTGGLQ